MIQLPCPGFLSSSNNRHLKWANQPEKEIAVNELSNEFGSALRASQEHQLYDLCLATDWLFQLFQIGTTLRPKIIKQNFLSLFSYIFSWDRFLEIGWISENVEIIKVIVTTNLNVTSKKVESSFLSMMSLMSDGSWFIAVVSKIDHPVAWFDDLWQIWWLMIDNY